LYHIYTDGACSGNRIDNGMGGYAAVIVKPNQKDYVSIGGGQKNTTNNRMEIYAAIAGFKKLSNILNQETEGVKCKIFSDSKYLVESWNHYLFDWVDRGWKRSNYRKVLNADLWKILYQISCNFQTVEFIWVRGHDGNMFNEIADKIAKEYSLKIKARSSK